jgi:predicted peptidase
MSFLQDNVTPVSNTEITTTRIRTLDGQNKTMPAVNYRDGQGLGNGASIQGAIYGWQASQVALHGFELFC